VSTPNPLERFTGFPTSFSPKPSSQRESALKLFNKATFDIDN
jgi:hypothetical protein